MSNSNQSLTNFSNICDMCTTDVMFNFFFQFQFRHVQIFIQSRLLHFQVTKYVNDEIIITFLIKEKKL